MHPLVSVIIPFYNAERFLAEAIGSALDQTWPNMEIILIDDGSTDHSQQVVKQFSGKNIKVITQANSGAAAARNAGLQEATGSYIQFLDADDLLSPEKIEKQISTLERAPGYLAICNGIHFWDGTEPSAAEIRDESQFLHDSDHPEEFLMNLYGKDNSGWMVSLHSWLSPAGLIKDAGPWNEALTMNDDGEFFCRVALASKGIKFVPGVYSYYRKFRNGHSVSAERSVRAMNSALLSLDLEANALAGAGGVDEVFDRRYYELAVHAFPEFMDVYREAWHKIRRPFAVEAPELGGPFLQMIAKWFGWRFARRLSVIKRRFKGA